MIEAGQKQNIILQYLSWHFFDVPRDILRAWKNFLRFYLHYFSIPLLIKTFFSPWRGYKWHYGRGFDIGKYLETLFSNLVCRSIGAILRFFLILIGVFVEIFIVLFGFFVFLGWFLLPIFLIFGLYHGIRILL